MQTPIDYVLRFATVEGSSMQQAPDTGDNVAVLFNVAGVDGLEDDGIGEANDAEVYGALGVVARPLPPVDGKNAEVVCMCTADGLVPIAAKDMRLKMPGAAPHAGTVALVGYGGGFHSMDPVEGGEGGTIHVIYCPYDFDSDGNAQKAHSVVLDPTSGNENISLIHADGHAVFIQNDGSIQMQSPDGSSSVKIEDGKITLQSDQVVLNGTVFVGSPLTGVPLMPGPASPPCPRLFVSPMP
ncbi:MAG: hypothetical protein GY854_02245 [Deltaproteobacteria bacterium]|nr:hypothetical protein [Deltaproteobacteria bacterium]